MFAQKGKRKRPNPLGHCALRTVNPADGWYSTHRIGVLATGPTSVVPVQRSHSLFRRRPALRDWSNSQATCQPHTGCCPVSRVRSPHERPGHSRLPTVVQKSDRDAPIPAVFPPVAFSQHPLAVVVTHGPRESTPPSAPLFPAPEGQMSCHTRTGVTGSMTSAKERDATWSGRGRARPSDTSTTSDERRGYAACSSDSAGSSAADDWRISSPVSCRTSPVSTSAGSSTSTGCAATFSTGGSTQISP